MGIDRWMTFGAFVKCKSKKIDVVTRRTACENKNCCAYQILCNSMYCPQCGSMIQSANLTTKDDEHQPDDVACDVLKERLISAQQNADDDWHYYRSNLTDFIGDLTIDIGQQEPFITETGEDHRQASLDAFHKRFASEIAKLQELYGTENVQVTYGLIWEE
jgi:hypothetical protein